MQQLCSVCSAEPAVREAVERMQKNGVKYSDIAKQSPFSKTALWRHCTRHAPRGVLAENRTFNKGDTAYVVYMNALTQAIVDHVNALPKNCWLIRVEYEPPPSAEKIAAYKNLVAQRLTELEKKQAAPTEETPTEETETPTE